MRLAHIQPRKSLAKFVCGVTAAAALAGAATSASPAGEPNEVTARKTSDQQVRSMKIRISFEGKAVTATLANSEASRDFASMLPLDLTLKDHARTEKISDLPRKLSIQASPPGTTPVKGDISYYSPWGNLAIFYNGFVYSPGLVKLGKMDSDTDLFDRSEPITARIELIEQ